MNGICHRIELPTKLIYTRPREVRGRFDTLPVSFVQHFTTMLVKRPLVARFSVCAEKVYARQADWCPETPHSSEAWRLALALKVLQRLLRALKEA